jgi:hypothetical protein
MAELNSSDITSRNLKMRFSLLVALEEIAIDETGRLWDDLLWYAFRHRMLTTSLTRTATDVVRRAPHCITHLRAERKPWAPRHSCAADAL